MRPLKRFSILRVLLLVVVWGGAAGAATVSYVVRSLNRELPEDLTTLLEYQPSRKSVVFSGDGEEIGSFSLENRKIIPLERMPAQVPAAFVSAEDRRFWQHPGFDIVGIGRAAWTNFRSDQIRQGGSTLTQQIIKQILLREVEQFDRTGMSADEVRAMARRLKYRRKALEVILSVRLERELSKPEILAIYLNHVYLGRGAYGVGAAAESYFGKDVENLTVAESAMLAGLVKSPSTVAPHLDFAAARARQTYVLARMLEDGYISQSEHAAALDEPIALVEASDLNHLAAPYFVEHIRRLATTRYGNAELFRGGLRFYSTLDTRAQAAAEQALRRGIEGLDKKLGFRGPIGQLAADKRAGFADGPARPYRPGGSGVGETSTDRVLADTTYSAMIIRLGAGHAGAPEPLLVDLGPIELPMAEDDAAILRGWRKDGERMRAGDLVPVRLGAGGRDVRLAQAPTIQGALVAMEPSTGRVVAMVGGYDWLSSQFNRVTQANRQIGSAIKPFIYAAAVADGATAVDRRYDGPIAVPTATGMWSPSNYDDKFLGSVTLRTALAKSLNTIAVQLLVDVGLDRVIEVMRGFGISSPIPRHVSISLGTPDFTLLEVAAGYAGLAAGGRRVEPRFFDLVTDAAGTMVTDNRSAPLGAQVVPADAAYVVVDMMKAVIQRGTGRRAADLGRPAAGKTGTSANHRDVWFIGFTPDLLCGVWLGRDDSTPIGAEITGGAAAVPIWLEFMRAAHPSIPPHDFVVPPGVVFVRTDEATGLASPPSANATWIPFVRGSAPSQLVPRIGERFRDRVAAPMVP